MGARLSCRTCRWLLEEQGRCHQNQEYRSDILSTDERGDRQAKRKGWNKAVKYAYGWAKDEPEEEEE